jgi:hypothetical protein
LIDADGKTVEGQFMNGEFLKKWRRWSGRSIGPEKKINVAWDSLIRLSGVILDLPGPGPGRLFF